jgi:hypothetical protein
MSKRTTSLAAALFAGIATISIAAGANAQAWHYPAFQPPTIATREFNFAIAGGGDYGTSGLFQWREGIGPDTHFSADVGFGDPDYSDAGFLIGAGLAQRVMRSTQDTPIDVLLTGGVYGEFGMAQSFVRIPIGAVVGHRFPIEGTKTAITPFVHPRVSFDACVSDCNGLGTKVKLNFDLGADFEVTQKLSLRGAILVGGVSAGDSQAGFGLGVAFHPGRAR